MHNECLGGSIKYPTRSLLAEVQLNIVGFRYNPKFFVSGISQLNEELGEAILRDGRVYAGIPRLVNNLKLRPAIANWRIREKDMDLFSDVVRKLGRN